MTLRESFHILTLLQRSYDLLQGMPDNTLGDIHAARTNIADAIRSLTIKIAARVNISSVTEGSE